MATKQYADTAVAAESAARQNGDTYLTNLVNLEAAERQSADSGLAARIAQVENSAAPSGDGGGYWISRRNVPTWKGTGQVMYFTASTNAVDCQIIMRGGYTGDRLNGWIYVTRDGAAWRTPVASNANPPVISFVREYIIDNQPGLTLVRYGYPDSSSSNPDGGESGGD